MAVIIILFYRWRYEYQARWQAIKFQYWAYSSQDHLTQSTEEVWFAFECLYVCMFLITYSTLIIVLGESKNMNTLKHTEKRLILKIDVHFLSIIIF